MLQRPKAKLGSLARVREWKALCFIYQTPNGVGRSDIVTAPRPKGQGFL